MLKRILSIVFTTALVTSCATTVKKNEMNGEELYNKGMDFLEASNPKKALPYLFEAYELSKESYAANLGLADAYLKLGEPEKAISHYEYYISGNKDVYGYGRTIQAYQALSETAKRDSKISELLEVWNGMPEERPLGYVRDSFLELDMKLFAFEEFDPKAPNMIFYRFIQADNAKQSIYVSLGSYDSTSEITRELEGKPEGWRLYHLDGYCSGGHRTYGFYDEKPTYDEVRKTILKIYSNNDFGC